MPFVPVKHPKYILCENLYMWWNIAVFQARLHGAFGLPLRQRCHEIAKLLDEISVKVGCLSTQMNELFNEYQQSSLKHSHKPGLFAMITSPGATHGNRRILLYTLSRRLHSLVSCLCRICTPCCPCCWRMCLDLAINLGGPWAN